MELIGEKVEKSGQINYGDTRFQEQVLEFS
jgi:hypothetical protein